MNHQSIREECCVANKGLPTTSLVDLGFGNVSVIDRSAGVFAIKPKSVNYANLTPEQMVIIDLEGNVVDGQLHPCPDTPTHLRLFLAFSEIGAVVHSHSRNAVAFAQALRPIPCLGTTHAKYFRGAVPVTRHMRHAEINGDYEWGVGNVIAETFSGSDPEDIPAVLVAGHGPFVWGSNAIMALEYAQALEVCAEMAFKTLALNPSVGSLPESLMEEHFFRKYDKEEF